MRPPRTSGYCAAPVLASYHAGRYSPSLNYWRTLLGGVDSGSEEWLEAKYYQLACLKEADRPTAEKVLQQFKVLFPNVKSPMWRDKFTELEKQLR